MYQRVVKVLPPRLCPGVVLARIAEGSIRAPSPEELREEHRQRVERDEEENALFE